MYPDPASVKAETSHAASDSGLLGRFRLVGLLAAGMFEEVGVHFVADAGLGVWHRPNGPGAAVRPWRAAGERFQQFGPGISGGRENREVRGQAMGTVPRRSRRRKILPVLSSG